MTNIWEALWGYGNKEQLREMREALKRETKLLEEAVIKAERKRKEQIGT